MTKNPFFWSTILLVAILIIYYLNENGYFDKGMERVTYKYPSTSDPEIFGKPMWSNIHDLVSRVPCPSCREKGKSLFIFAHDLVNFKLQKNIWDKDNFLKWQDYICKIDINKKDNAEN